MSSKAEQKVNPKFEYSIEQATRNLHFAKHSICSEADNNLIDAVENLIDAVKALGRMER